MSEENKKAEKIEPEVKPVELSEQDLEQVAGGVNTPDSQKHKDAQSILKYVGS